LRRKLQHKGYPADELDTVLTDLTAEGLLSDLRYVQCRLRSRAAQGYGKLRIRQELLSQGLSEDIVDRELEQDGTDWQAMMMQVRDKRFGAELPSDSTEIARQARFLQYRGFSSRMIHRLLHHRDSDD